MCRKLDDLWKESKKADFEINSSKTEEIRINTTAKQRLRLNGEDIKISSDFYYLGSIVAENGGTSREVGARIQKARGSFSKLRRLWLCKLLRKDTKIRIFNACVKSVLFYGCETWLVTKEIQRKMSKIYIKNMVVKYYFQQRPMESNRTRRYKCRNKKKKFIIRLCTNKIALKFT
jgi:hypothetical protein